MLVASRNSADLWRPALRGQMEIIEAGLDAEGNLDVNSAITKLGSNAFIRKIVVVTDHLCDKTLRLIDFAQQRRNPLPVTVIPQSDLGRLEKQALAAGAQLFTGSLCHDSMRKVALPDCVFN